MTLDRPLPDTMDPSLTAAVWRYRWLVLLAAAIGLVAAVLFEAIPRPEAYRATASMVVEDPRSSVLFDVGNRQRREDYLADQLEILRSGAVAVNASDIASLETGQSITASDLIEATEIEGGGDSSLIFVQVTSGSEEVAIASANALVTAYQEFLTTQTEATFASSLQVLDDTIGGLADELELVGLEIDSLTAAANPELAALQQQARDDSSRLTELFASLQGASEETRTVLRNQIQDILTQLDAVGRYQQLEDSSVRLTELISRQNRIATRINDLAERRDRIKLDSQLLSSGVTASIPAFQAAAVVGNARVTLGIGLALGLLSGIAIAYALAIRRRSFDDRSQPEAVYAAPLIAEIPNFKQEGIKDPLPVRSHPRSASAEGFRFAATTLVMSNARVITVVSGGLGEGKTVVAANTALAAAREGNKVLVIDADFGNQMASALLAPGATPTSGLTEVVEEGFPLPQAIVEIEGVGAGGLHLLTRGWRQTTAPEFFRLPTTREFLVHVQSFYDLIIIDVPPLLQVAYASTVTGLSSQVLVVVPHGSGLEDAREVRDRLELIGSTIAGYVYNLAPLRLEMTRTEGSMKDILGGREAVPS